MWNRVCAMALICSPAQVFANDISTCNVDPIYNIAILVAEGAFVDHSSKNHSLDTVVVETLSGEITVVCMNKKSVVILVGTDATIVITKPPTEAPS